MAVIINNKNFLRSSGMDRYPRNGTDVDRDSLVKLFKMLKFEVKVYNDQTKAEIRRITKEMATCSHSNYDAFIFSILTHGEEGVIYGTDGTISIRDLTAEFKYSTTLAGKPKIFFFQACQGKNIDTYYIGTEIYTLQMLRIKIVRPFWRRNPICHTIFFTCEKYCMTNHKPNTIFFTSEENCIRFYHHFISLVTVNTNMASR